MTKYLSIEMSKQLFALGAFSGRAFEVGDRVQTGELRVELVTCAKERCLYTHREDMGVSYAAAKYQCILLPRLDDVLDELGNPDLQWVGQQNYDDSRVHLCTAVANQFGKLITYSATGVTTLEAAAKCLITILEAKAEAKQEVEL